MRIAVDTLDDALKEGCAKLLSTGEVISSSRGNNRELLGVQIEISNPLARLSLAESRATLFSCLGEFCWYLAKSDELDFISYYAPKYPKYVHPVRGRVLGAYGPRLFDWKGLDQVRKVIDLLNDRQSSKQAVIQIFDREDVAPGQRDVPCTCTLHFLARNGRLHLITMMRSNDAFRGLPPDVFAFTMLQELIAHSLGLDIGIYRHWVGSFHLYEEDEPFAQKLIAEGWQQTINGTMPAMPYGDQWSFISELLRAERSYRIDKCCQEWSSTGSDYWDDLIKLLEIHRHLSNRDLDRAESSAQKLHAHQYYSSFIRTRMDQIRRNIEQC